MFEFESKANTLLKLKSKLKSAHVLPLYIITVSEWSENSSTCLSSVISEDWFEWPVIVRSSNVSEDSGDTTLAGHYTSVLDVNDEESLRQAINEVISSYENNSDKNQVFIQPMLQSVKLSGVAFTRDPNTSGPYFIINYNQSGEDTTSVTSGSKDKLQTYIRHFNSKSIVPEELRGVLALCNELHEITGCEPIDIEFGVDANKDCYLFQVRRLLFNNNDVINDKKHTEILVNIENKIRQLNQPHPYLAGQKTVFGIMPDWNPAEIIGIRPQPLALSLYRDLITDATWAYQRGNYGYRNLRSVPLMVNLHGLPYIDVRVSFNSFIPKDIDDELAEKLVNYYLNSLINAPELHDKVEFEIVYSCYTLDLPEKLARLDNFGFSKDEVQRLELSLRDLTNSIINSDTGLWQKDLGKIDELELRRKKILSSNIDRVSKIYWLIEDCRRYGTLPFAGLARAGFIAIQLLNSLVSVKVLTQEEADRFMSSLTTVTSTLSRDITELSREKFLSIYGHLRPGTYDIRSKRYDEDPERFFDWNSKHDEKITTEEFSLSIEQLKTIEKLLEKHGLEHDVLGLFEFIKAGVEGREYAKFVFTRSLSDALSLFCELGEEHNFSREDCSYADIRIIKELIASSYNTKYLFEKSIKIGKDQFSLTRQLNLPPLIIDENDVWSFYQSPSEPNFITQKRICASIAVPDENDNLSEMIVFIPSADPGFDWIFTRDIAGLVTKYGGVNSHMAIRAGELGIPAIIGAGDQYYDKWVEAKELLIDCAERKVEIVS